MISDVIINNQQIGSVACCFLLLNLKIVKSSRDTIVVSPLCFKNLTKSLITDQVILNEMSENNTAYYEGVNSNIGRRKVYGELCKDQHTKFGKCEITFDEMLSNYKFRKVSKNDDKVELAIYLKANDFNNNKEKFKTQNYVFLKRSIQAITRKSPYIAFDENDERSCYSILLFYIPWPSSGEESDIVANNETAVSTLTF